MLYRSLLLWITLALQAVPAVAQRIDPDSLLNLINTTQSDTMRVWQLNLLATTIREQDSKHALKYAEEARDLALLLNYKRGQCNALENIGWIYYRRGEFSEAFELSADALKLAEAIDDKMLAAKCHNTIAAVRIEQKQYSEGIADFKIAYEISREINDLPAMARSINNIAFCFLQNEQIDSANFYAKQALALSKQANTRYLLGFALRTLGDIDMAEGRYQDALLKFNEVIGIATELRNIFLQVSTNHRIGKAHYVLGKYTQALNTLIANLDVARKYGFKSELERSLKLIAEIHASAGELHRAYDYQGQYLSVHDSLQEQRNNEKNALLQARFDSEIKEARIELLTKEAQLKQEEINSQRLWMYFSIGCLTLMMILAFVLLYSNRLKKKANDELASKNEEIAEQAAQLKSINTTKDKLFSIISHDLRSPLASLRGLVTVMGLGGLSKDEFIESSRKLRKNLDSVQGDLDNLLVWAQSQLNGLQSNPVAMRLRPVIEEKIDLFSEVAHQKDITILNEVDESLSIVADRNHMGLVIRNLLANAIKFNRPGGLIRISEKRVGDFFEISVTDSGIGMTPNDLGRLFNAATHFTNPGTHQEKGAGIGLLLTKEFIEKDGGMIWAKSELGNGSSFTFTVRPDVKQHRSMPHAAHSLIP
ncbi:tetratricopeptide repeat-containing sensor histidine kinase [Chryseolinea sp. T2]|uniref:tetratricopeptide repeat-containing sensor histidine kinase n=1 Tax=Chryseolinea sp. T2 TaxID=3129255 RepID=UPI0030785DBA